MSEQTTPPKQDEDANKGAKAAKEFTAAEAVKAFGKKGITVRLPKTDKAGNPIRAKDKVTGRDAGYYITEDQDLAPEHLVSFRKERGVVTIVTIDGARYRSNEAEAV